MRALVIVYLLAALVAFTMSASLAFAAAEAADPQQEAGSGKKVPKRVPHGLDVITPAPEADAKLAKKVQSLYQSSRQRQSIRDETPGKWDRILTIGDLHGDMQHTMTLLTDLKIISHQPDYYRDLIAKEARAEKLRLAKGLKPKNRKRQEAKFTNDGLDEEVQSNDIAANMLYNKRGDLMNGATADEYHWAAGKILVVVLGDSLNVGPDDIPIVQFLRRLTREASEAKGKLVYVLGNHEVNNLKGNYLGVHPWSFESSGGEEGRRRLLSTETRLGRFLRSRPGVFYYDHLMFMHGGLMPQAVKKVEQITGHANMTGQEFADTVNQHVRSQLFDFENDPSKIDTDPLAAIVTNVNYDENGEDGVLLVHPLDKCDKVEEANRMAVLQSQVVGHTPHELPEYRFCDGSLFAIDFLMSQWKGGTETPLAALELTRVAMPPAANGEETAPYKWSSRLLIPKKDAFDIIQQVHRIGRLWFVVLVVLGVVAVESIVMLVRRVLRRRKALAQFR